MEKLKTEVKDLKEIEKLNNVIEENVEKDDENITGKKEETPNSATEEKEYNCFECCFQGSGESELKSHIILKHRTPLSQIGSIKCRTCGNTFSVKWELMKHRKASHINTVAKCKNYLNKSCPYTEELCWWVHSERTKDSDISNCYMCGKQFENKNQIMIHRRKEHGKLVGLCRMFQNQNCKFVSENCWFKHEMEDKTNRKNENKKEEIEEESVFQNVLDDLDPPLGQRKN